MELIIVPKFVTILLMVMMIVDGRTNGGWVVGFEVSVRMPWGGWSTTAPSVTGDSAHSTNNNDNRTGRRSFVSLS